MMRVSSPTTARRGVVLLGVLVVIVVLSLAAYQFSEMMSAEYAAMGSYTRTTQTRGLVESGVHYTAAMLADPFAIAGQLANNPYDNPASFRDVLVQDNSPNGPRGMFSVLTLPRPEDVLPGGFQHFRFGVEDENSKLNLNAILQYNRRNETGFNMLMCLPNMTEDTANAILDWLDEDDTPRAGGAESETYSSMTPPYRCKNGPLDSLEELLLVRGVTPRLLFGNDRNRNGKLDPDEDDGSGVLDRGWQAYLTVYSVERNVDDAGEARIFLNDRDQFALWGSIDAVFPDNPEVMTFILAYRLYGGQSVGEDEEMPEAPTGEDLELVQAKVQVDFLIKRGRSIIPTIWHLLYKKVTVQIRAGRNTRTIVLPSPFADPEKARELLPILFDRFTTRKSPDLTPRINITTASPTVLSMLPNLTEEDLAAIQAAQPSFENGSVPDPIYATPTWLYTEAGLSPRTLRSLDRYVSTRSQVYRFQVVGYFDQPGAVSRVEAVVDGNNGRPRIVYWRDLTELGPGFPLGGNVPLP